jgi:hypothetical protein
MAWNVLLVAGYRYRKVMQRKKFMKCPACDKPMMWQAHRERWFCTNRKCPDRKQVPQ